MTLCVVRLSSTQLSPGSLTALVESVQPVDVVVAHLGGLSEGDVAVGQHGGAVVLREGVPGESQIQV